MVMHPLDSLKSGVSWLLEKLGIVSKEAAKAKLPESVTRQQPATVNADGKVMMPSVVFHHGDMALRGCMTAVGISRAAVWHRR
ncbi:TP901 family phage tail tape measure protein [Escherichia coli]|nr:TP901 family phage tail tape measure protein [Escherichia coli]